MIERGIIFSAPMVRALLAGEKTQTRRLLKLQPPTPEQVRQIAGDGFHYFTDASTPGEFRVAGPVWAVRKLGGPERLRCPYGVPGDRLWVRETWRPTPPDRIRAVTVHYAADRGMARFYDVPRSWKYPKAAANGNVTPIHMPRWASRITLEITSVRVERLQAITSADIVAEGIPAVDYSVNDRPDALEAEQRDAFVKLWDSINGDVAPWSSNPFLWVLGFRRVEAKERAA